MNSNPTREILKIIDKRMQKVDRISRYIDHDDVFAVRIYGDNIRGSKISTQQFDGTGDYIQMERQYLTFWDTSSGEGIVKMALGFIPDKDGNNIPGIVFGAGDGYGGNRGYITKDPGALSMYYIGDLQAGEVSYIRLDKDKAQINGYDIFVKDAANPINDTYIANAVAWNQKLNEMQAKAILEDPTKDWSIPVENLSSGVVSSINSGVEARTFFNVDGLLEKARIAAAAEWDAKISEGHPKLTELTDTGIYTGTLSASQIVSGQIAAERIAVLPDSKIQNISDYIKYNDGQFTYIGPTGIYTGTLSASQITAGQIAANYIETANLKAERICKPGDQGGYGVIGGPYGELQLYWYDTMYFSIYNGVDYVSLKKNGDTRITFGSSNNSAMGHWDFEYTPTANSGLLATQYWVNTQDFITSYNADQRYCRSMSNQRTRLNCYHNGTNWVLEVYDGSAYLGAVDLQ